MATISPCDLTLNEASRLIAAGRLLPSDLLESCLERIGEREPEVMAWEHLDVQGARSAASLLDRQPATGALHGIPVGVKDIIDVAGMPTGCGSSLRSGHVAGQDAWVTARLRTAGAVILGKTVTTEFAYFTPGRTRNPHHLQHTPGGSSSGSAAAVADHMVPLALGTQTAASTTRPAAYCGVAGLVTTPGRLSGRGIAGLSPTLDSLGLLARGVEDLSLAHAVLLGRPWRPSPASGAPRLLVCPANPLGDLTPQMHEALLMAAKCLERAGADLTTLVLDEAQARLPATHVTVMAREASGALATEAATGRLSRPLQDLLDHGNAISDGEYAAALGHATAQRRRLVHRLDGHDAILTPAAPGSAPRGLPTGDPAFSRAWQVLGLPTVTVPGLRNEDGMPLGLQVVGAPDGEEHLLAVARWVERNLQRVSPDAV